jgi:hypothetical protein
LITLERNNKKETIIYHGSSVLAFTLVEIDCGRNPVIFWSQEISKEEYEQARPYYFKNL